MKNCFPGIGIRWTRTIDLRKNAYLNLFTFAGADLSEEMIYVEMYTRMPLLEDQVLSSVELDNEKKLAYVNCLYYEEFYHEDEQFKSVVLKKMKNRITSPVVYVKAECLNVDGEDSVPCICCGYDDEQNAFVIVNPSTGEYESLDNNWYSVKNNHKKMIMLNIPGMNRIHQIPNNIAINNAIRIYRKQLLNYKDVLTWKKTGVEALKSLDKNTLNDKNCIMDMINWIDTSLKFEFMLDDTNVKFLRLLRKIYVELLNQNLHLMRGYIDEIEQLNWK